jgi:hypothetical protein
MYFSPNNFLLTSRPPMLRQASLHRKWPLTVAGKLYNQLDTSHKHKPHQSCGLTMDKQSEQGSEAEKKNPTDKRRRANRRTCAQHGSWQTRAQKVNMEQKEDRDQLSRHSAPIPSGCSQGKNSTKEAHQPLRKGTRAR